MLRRSGQLTLLFISSLYFHRLRAQHAASLFLTRVLDTNRHVVRKTLSYSGRNSVSRVRVINFVERSESKKKEKKMRIAVKEELFYDHAACMSINYMMRFIASV